MKEIKAFKCDYCGKLYQRKHFCNWHENMCHNNPINSRPCFSCGSLIKKEESIYIDHPDGSEGERRVTCFYCEKNKYFLYTPQNEMKGNYYDFGDIANEPMPLTCDKYKNTYDSEFLSLL